MIFALSRTALILALTATMGTLTVTECRLESISCVVQNLSGHPCIWVFYLTKYTFFNHINLIASLKSLSNSLKMVLKL